ncbi:deoxyribose-phosphate aldolase [Gramella sp. KN1008]|uniref:deoxyribose-phosphate aldolase n=1 Tax=Gramella sp. KN1008 TaxID=2529298 RepID=UPI001040A495|nr:deoxyribose-phosphate aldolase [Gramella sp. KN1008]TBW27999.1 deoxyribose-phosphate aldolase [Gramella sp. KN1008]
MELSKFIDHTLLSASAQVKDIEQLCKEAVQHRFYAVCVNSCYMKEAKAFLGDSGVKLAATIGFPLGASSMVSKIEEARQAVDDGADEIDMVINVGYLKDGRNAEVQEEIASIKKAIGEKLLKVILETCYLSEEEIKLACELSLQAGADFVKTSTGFGSRGASLEDIRIMKEVVKDKMQIKASGGIRDYETALEYVKMGVDRIGTSSGIKIISKNQK